MHFHTTSQNCEGGLRKQYTELLLKTLLFLKHTHTKGKSKPQTVSETEQKKKKDENLVKDLFCSATCKTTGCANHPPYSNLTTGNLTKKT